MIGHDARSIHVGSITFMISREASLVVQNNRFIFLNDTTPNELRKNQTTQV